MIGRYHMMLEVCLVGNTNAELRPVGNCSAYSRTPSGVHHPSSSAAKIYGNLLQKGEACA